MSYCPVSIHSEFQTLEEVIVGKTYSPEAFSYLEDTEHRDGLQRILYETEEDLLTLVRILEEQGIKVRRPEIMLQLSENGETKTFDIGLIGLKFPNHPLMPRDTVLVVGNQLIQMYTKNASRYFESCAYYNLFLEYFNGGAKWYSMPPPLLEGDPSASYNDFEDKKIFLHAANVLKCGRDLFCSQTGFGPWGDKVKGTQAGFFWLKNLLGDQYRIHVAPCPGHLDGKIALIKPGLLATWDLKCIPEALKKWDVIPVEWVNHFPERFKKIKKRRFYKQFVQQWLKEWIGYADETVFDINMFSISENLVITNGYNKKVYGRLEKAGVKAIPWNFRHQYFWDGAIHCVTLDIRRSGSLEDYFIS